MTLYAENIPGNAAEVGVYRGGTARIIAKCTNNKLVHLFDTFSGLPAPDSSIDRHKKGDFSDTSLEEVKHYLKNCKNIVWHPGFFPETTKGINETYSFVHIDVDIYESVKDCLEHFYDRLAGGGVIILDDYKWPATPGVAKAVDEFFVNKPEKPFIAAKYQAVIVKN